MRPMKKKTRQIISQLFLVVLGLIAGIFGLRATEPTRGLVAGPERMSYAWRLYDLFDQGEFKLIEKPGGPEYVRKIVHLEWSGNLDAQYTVQISSRSDFREFETARVTGVSFVFDHPFVGENFWRVSGINGSWSERRMFRLEPEFLPDPPPQVVMGPTQIVLDTSVKTSVIQLKTSFAASGFVVETSTAADFSGASTQRFWTSNPKVVLSFFAIGTYHYRFRAVNQSQEMTDWSLPSCFHVVAPTDMSSDSTVASQASL